MSPMPPAVGRGGSASSRFRHPQIQLRQLPERGAGYVAIGLLKRGELLLEAGILENHLETCRKKESMKLKM